MNTWVDRGEIIDLVQWIWTAAGVVLVIIVCVFAGLIILRKRSPHSEKRDRTQTQVNKKMYPGGKIVPDTVQAGANGKKSLLDRTKELGLSAQVFWNLVAVITGIALWYAIPNTEIRPKDVGNWSQNYWLQILIVWFVGAVLIWLNANERNEKSVKTLQTALAGVMILLLIVFPFWSWIATSSESGCVKGHPCILAQDDSGSSGAVEVPLERVACFDPWIWNHLDEVGLMISYQDPGGHGQSFPCSREQVFKGNCMAVYDRFWFKPSQKTRLPNYWFVASGSKQC